VLRLLEHLHSRAERIEEARNHYRSGQWTFLGWEVKGLVVACAGSEPLDSGTIGIRSIAVAPTWRNRGIGRALIDALAKQAEAEHVVADTDDDAVGFYRSCGFSVEDAPPKFGRTRYWCTRDMSA